MKKRNERVVSKKITFNRIAIVTLSKADKNSIVGCYRLNPQEEASSWPPCDITSKTLVTYSCEMQY
ncbi:hypothetical protein [Chitinophaga nivalis]|uniref:Uncharacterized protein n=1 Tax=Chitinophaga nivalis TaxID=2991709 RepID=A0ABT3IGT3_9BACT|nr:hypothetical protein [Chitinophaga nivalis]MCW3467131.1 hypothetical protein [Chitinophaga nivalis]MCW3483178.1 hypothetical protein [Chitinophaga nivalis]